MIIDWNKAAESLFGCGESEAIGKRVSMLASEEHVVHFDTVRRRKDGSHIHVSLSVSPIKDAEGNVIGAASIARDITERKRVEEQMALTVAKLRRREHEMTLINQMRTMPFPEHPG